MWWYLSWLGFVSPVGDFQYIFNIHATLHFHLYNNEFYHENANNIYFKQTLHTENCKTTNNPVGIKYGGIIETFVINIPDRINQPGHSQHTLYFLKSRTPVVMESSLPTRYFLLTRWRLC